MPPKISTETAISDLSVGLTRTLALICNQLIDNRALNKELLIADLAQLQKLIEENGGGPLVKMLPMGLAHALGQSAEHQP